MYDFEQVLEGIKYSVFFFSTFTGHFHPFTPNEPIDLEEMYSPQRRSYYLAWYIDDEPEPTVNKVGVKKTDPKLMYLEKYWIRFYDFPAPEGMASQPGTYFYLIRQDNTGVKLESPIDAKTSLSKNEFYMYRINEKGNLIGSWTVRRGLMDKYSYTYKPGGALEDVKVEVLDLPED
jgi:hypothetical protein